MWPTIAGTVVGRGPARGGMVAGMLGLSCAFLAFLVLLGLWLVLGWALEVTRQGMLVFLKGSLEESYRVFRRACCDRMRLMVLN